MENEIEDVDSNINSSDLLSNEPEITSEWKREEEYIMKEWADKSMCYKWLHNRAYRKFKKKNIWYTIPVIIMSTLTGTANFAQDKVSDEYKGLFSSIVGGINILAGIITTIQQYLKIAELNESHRVASISWDKFYRNLKIELAKHPKDRTPVIQMMKIGKEEYDRLMETSPPITHDIIKFFNTKFPNLENIVLPEVCDKLNPTIIYRSTSNENIKIKQQEKVNKFIQRFKTIKGRVPTSGELDEEMNHLNIV